MRNTNPIAPWSDGEASAAIRLLSIQRSRTPSPSIEVLPVPVSASATIHLLHKRLHLSPVQLLWNLESLIASTFLQEIRSNDMSTSLRTNLYHQENACEQCPRIIIFFYLGFRVVVDIDGQAYHSLQLKFSRQASLGDW